ncbi:MAG TPA: hypothetical protein PK453_23205 [Leptospiraceae bacterium]|nr:hypothetical protein [Leptospiraceae bacterium]HNF16582.1 hypothetical protein [Leptospiraceae bacterium]HNH08692.1 hypothetical protein [Leptospiraceae bacterium]HNI95813.1 hypothetical protein [Leptospiraceae bacterium]HNM01549.1 hypothetical protein [Leptospiraceae bacterium]
MKSLKYITVLYLFSMSVSACMSANPKVPDGPSPYSPIAKNIIVYSIGGSVVSGIADSSALKTARLRLPFTAGGINLYQNGESLKWFTVQAVENSQKSSLSEQDKYLLVGLPELKSGELKFNYVMPEITWLPKLNASIIDSKTLTLQLQALITVGADEVYKNCDVNLVLNNSLGVDRISGHTFSLNSFDLYPKRNIVYNLDNKTSQYTFLREWHTYLGKDEVRVLVQVKNPFSIDLNQTGFSVESNQISIESGSIESQVRPGEILSLGAGTDDSIYTFRSVKITESADKKTLPFNHKISYKITNKSNQEKKLRLVSSRVMGTDHRSVYHFKRQPDATPENTLIWILSLKPGVTETLEYDYDADIKDVPGENGFEAGG